MSFQVNYSRRGVGHLIGVILPKQGCDCIHTSAAILLTCDDPSWINLNLNVIENIDRLVDSFQVIDLRFADIPGISLSTKFPPNITKTVDPIKERVGSEGNAEFDNHKPLRHFEALPTSVQRAVASSVKSALFSFLATDRPSRYSPLKILLEFNLIRAAKRASIAVDEVLSKTHFCFFLAPNGRFPTQAGPVKVAEEYGIPVVFYERGFAENSLYWSGSRPQDYKKLLEDSRTYEASEDALTKARKWLSDRTLPSGTNSFSSRWGAENSLRVLRKLSEEIPSKDDLILSFFTSSQDEFWALGDLLPRHNRWRSQYDAFSAVSQRAQTLVDPSLKMVLRMHPNTVNKSPGYAARETLSALIMGLRFPRLLVIWPNERVSSYMVLEMSKYVCVWDSTIGVEAMAIGKHVIHLETGYFEPASSATNYVSIDDYFSKQSEDATKFALLSEVSVANNLERSTYPLANLIVVPKFSRAKTLRHTNSITGVLLLLSHFRNRVFASMLFACGKYLLNTLQAIFRFLNYFSRNNRLVEILLRGSCGK